ncbi:MAG: DALR anticodon-binding domain-containing protein [Armatimonadota bacterium]|nr:DALR anticodon-binding domain-containing protein [Armatimonadota bacterium]
MKATLGATRHELHAAIQRAVAKASANGELSLAGEFRMPSFWVKRAPAGQGEFASNVALALASAARITPQQVAAILRAHLLSENIWPGDIEEANGFLNFQLDDPSLANHVTRALTEGARYGAGSTLSGRRINLEFVSADPTGPLPFAAGRIAAAGEALCRLLEFQGADVTREFFLNDVELSPKLHLLGESVAAFYLAAFGREGEWPEGALRDNFVRSVAESIVRNEGNVYLLVPEAERTAAFAHRACEAAIAAQKRTLSAFGVNFDVWASENALRREGRVSAAIEKLKQRGYTYERDGALWLRTSAFGDEADRPLVRANSQPTYLAADIAYHSFKFERGFDLLLNIWTMEHRPYAMRTRAALRAAGCDAERLEVLLCESARLLRDGRAVITDKGGGPLTLEEAMRDIDPETLRFWFLGRDWNEVVEVEIEVACRDDEANPGYAARLAPARLGTMIRELEAVPGNAGAMNQPLAATSWSTEERELLRLVALWPDEAETAAQRREPQRVARFVTEMAAAVRQLLAESGATVAESHAPARLQLLRAAQITVSNALHLCGVEVRERF